MKEIKTLQIRDFFTKWWSERWVRGIVFMLFPIGIVDTYITLFIAQLYGPEVEFNPITSYLLSVGLWLPWAILNIGAFMLFSMLAGSYYLHTRWNHNGPDTLWLSFVIALRVGMIGYNITFMYLPYIVTIYPPFWVAIFSFGLTLYLMNKLLKRRHDLSWYQAKHYLTSKIQDRKDAKLIESAGVPQEETPDMATRTREIKREIKEDRSNVEKPFWRRVWFQRGAYLTGSALSFILMGISIQVISEVTGLRAYTDGPYFILNEFTGPPVMASFIAIMFFMGMSIAFIMRAFSTTQEYVI